MVTVFNNRPTAQECSVALKRDDETILSQELEMPPLPENGQSKSSSIFQTGLRKGTELTAMVTNNGQTVKKPFELKCGAEYKGDSFWVKLYSNGEMIVSGTKKGSSCY